MDHGLFGPDSIVRRVHQETAVVALSWPRALLLQLAHPLVAAGVAEHSRFEDDPLGRFWHTFDSTLRIVFGSTEEALGAIDQVNTVHSRIHGVLPQKVGQFSAGTPYDATDPELLLWVHATGLESELSVYHRFVSPLTPAQHEQYYDEMKKPGVLLGIPESLMPFTLSDLHTYIQDMVESDRIAVGPDQRNLARSVLHPLPWALPLVANPLFEPFAAIVLGLLPERVRKLYGFAFTAVHRRIYAFSPTMIRVLSTLMPNPIRRFPLTRARRRLHAA